MKLVDILARQLKEWPGSRIDKISQSSVDSEFYGENTLGEVIWGKYLTLEKCAPNGMGGKRQLVTRAQWQAAVDALKADECEHSHGNAEGCPECGMVSAPAWSGEGLPPVGTVCEFKDPDGELPKEWIRGKVEYCSEVTAVISHDSFESGRTESILYPRQAAFRPIRTPEQIASDERESHINGMLCHDPFGGSRRGLAEALYDAGYRKQESAK